MKLITLITISFILLFISCSNEETSEDATNSETENTINSQADSTKISEKTKDISANAGTETTHEYKGFVGNSPITAHLTFNENQGTFTGYYVYDAYDKKIPLTGKETDWYGGPVYALEETNDQGELTGRWVFMREEEYGVFKARFESPDGASNLDIVLCREDAEKYLDPSSKMLFDSQEDADHFFSTHFFHHNETKLRGGVILHSPTDEEYMTGAILLPTGLTIYDHSGGDGFYVEPVGKVGEDNTIIFDDGKKEQLLFNWESNAMMEFEYEFQCLRFFSLSTSEYVFVNTEPTGFYLSIKELEKYGYHLEGDGHWLVKRSGKVLGYYPNGSVTVYENKNVNSKQLLTVNTDEDGYFSVQDVINFNNQVWAKVTFDYFTEVPCEGTIKTPQPSVSGWTPLYFGELKNILHFGFYSRGC
ncbi:hypothetical protein [Parvicella tangerina]|uniref:WG repeat-containing protein n=1 Tax=Parvicella tangerina TaxID=2829795 RepID=A0A916JM17_9FLAO|nr:hypothetical protein [Parvicella tangerina]CAG5080700.1 hypothetical protein CRYO30217_01422 [Parvicella tangerina]